MAYTKACVRIDRNGLVIWNDGNKTILKTSNRVLEIISCGGSAFLTSDMGDI